MGKWTRRALITTGVMAGGGLAVGIALRPGHRAPELAGLVTGDDEYLLNVWVKIATDNRVTAIVPHCEMGQGAQTALAQMLADELDAAWSDVSCMEAPAEDEYANWALGKGFLLGESALPKIIVPTVDGLLLQATKAFHLQMTGGSASVRATGVAGMRVAGAAAREVLMQAAAQEWQVPVAELTTLDSHVVHAKFGQRAAYGTLAEAAAQFEPSRTPKLKMPGEFRVMGTNVARIDIPAKVDGSAKFSIDAETDNMKYAAIRQAPVFGNRVESFDDGAARSMQGVVDVVDLGDAVAVVADGYWQAEQALAQVDIVWSQSEASGKSSVGLFEQFAADVERAKSAGETNADIELGDTRLALEAAEQVVEATYRVPYLAHACMEPMNATAAVSGDRCEVWVGSQNPLGFRYEVADVLEIPAENVTLHQHVMGGGFGRRISSETAQQAALISRASGVPVKLIWSREEDIRHDRYRPAVTSQFKAGISASGELLAWENAYHEKHDPAEAPLIPYAVSAQHIHYGESPTHVPFGAWRSVDHSQHGFFTESFIDEVAHAADRDPYEYRRELLQGKPRHLAVLDTAARAAGWGEDLGEGRGRGISIQESFGTLVAQVVDVTVTQGEVSVDRVVAAADAGFVVSPDGFTAQIESGIIYGLSAALYGEIEIAKGAVVQSNFHDYPVVRMAAAPAIETHIINSGAQIGGAGEPGTPGIAPALANAVFEATGTRVRQLPLSKYDFTYSIEEPEEVI
jgi:isoquinoline 1-oxidoreductase beta subunit